MMDLLQALHERHSVRTYENRPLSVEAVQALDSSYFAVVCVEKSYL